MLLCAQGIALPVTHSQGVALVHLPVFARADSRTVHDVMLPLAVRHACVARGRAIDGTEAVSDGARTGHSRDQDRLSTIHMRIGATSIVIVAAEHGMLRAQAGVRTCPRQRAYGL